MDEQKILGDRFEANRKHLYRVAYRMLGSPGEAEDAVQEAWLRLSRAGAEDVDNLSGWLTTVVARVCLDMLRVPQGATRRAAGSCPMKRAARRGLSAAAAVQGTIDPEQEALLADSVGLALLVVLQTLAPAERVAFVLHDMFDLSSTRSRKWLVARRLPHASSRVVPAAVCKASPPCPRSISVGSAASSRPSSQHRVAAISKGCSQCSIPMWWCVPTAPP